MLVTVTFNLQYCYILSSWEGFAYDGRVLVDVIQNQGFIIPEDKYYLANAGYSNSDNIIILYQKKRYHLKE